MPSVIWRQRMEKNCLREAERETAAVVEYFEDFKSAGQPMDLIETAMIPSYTHLGFTDSSNDKILPPVFIDTLDRQQQKCIAGGIPNKVSNGCIVTTEHDCKFFGTSYPLENSLAAPLRRVADLDISAKYVSRIWQLFSAGMKTLACGIGEAAKKIRRHEHLNSAKVLSKKTYRLLPLRTYANITSLEYEYGVKVAVLSPTPVYALVAADRTLYHTGSEYKPICSTDADMGLITSLSHVLLFDIRWVEVHCRFRHQFQQLTTRSISTSGHRGHGRTSAHSEAERLLHTRGMSIPTAAT